MGFFMSVLFIEEDVVVKKDNTNSLSGEPRYIDIPLSIYSSHTERCLWLGISPHSDNVGGT